MREGSDARAGPSGSQVYTAGPQRRGFRDYRQTAQGLGSWGSGSVVGNLGEVQLRGCYKGRDGLGAKPCCRAPLLGAKKIPARVSKGPLYFIMNQYLTSNAATPNWK